MKMSTYFLKIILTNTLKVSNSSIRSVYPHSSTVFCFSYSCTLPLYTFNESSMHLYSASILAPHSQSISILSWIFLKNKVKMSNYSCETNNILLEGKLCQHILLYQIGLKSAWFVFLSCFILLAFSPSA